MLQVLLKDYGPSVDVWSVGVLTYVLLCGGPPFWGDTDEDLFRSILQARSSKNLIPLVSLLLHLISPIVYPSPPPPLHPSPLLSLYPFSLFPMPTF